MCGGKMVRLVKAEFMKNAWEKISRKTKHRINKDCCHTMATIEGSLTRSKEGDKNDNVNADERHVTDENEKQKFDKIRDLITIHLQPFQTDSPIDSVAYCSEKESIIPTHTPSSRSSTQKSIKSLIFAPLQKSSKQPSIEGITDTEFHVTDINVSMNPTYGLVNTDSCSERNAKKMNKDDQQSEKLHNVFLAGDSCLHCAKQGLEMTARQSRLSSHLLSSQERNKMFRRPFHSEPKISCEFQFSFSFFLPEPTSRQKENIASVPLMLSTLRKILPPGSRMRLRLNDHLRGEEGIRGWLLILEGLSADILLSAIEAVDAAVPNWKLMEQGKLFSG